MGITVEELPGYLRRLADDIARKRAAERIVTNMGFAYQREVAQSMHGPAPSPPGTPPARRTGTLVRSLRTEPARPAGEFSAQTSVAPHTVYARIQQSGGEIHARHLTRDGKPGFLRWESDGVVHFARSVRLPPRPYMIMPPPYRQAVHDAAVAAANGLLP
jgi:hypothetical protein